MEVVGSRNMEGVGEEGVSGTREGNGLEEAVSTGGMLARNPLAKSHQMRKGGLQSLSQQRRGHVGGVWVGKSSCF